VFLDAAHHVVQLKEGVAEALWESIAVQRIAGSTSDAVTSALRWVMKTCRIARQPWESRGSRPCSKQGRSTGAVGRLPHSSPQLHSSRTRPRCKWCDSGLSGALRVRVS